MVERHARRLGGLAPARRLAEVDLYRDLDARVEPARTSPQRARFLTAGTHVTLGFGLGMRYEAIVQPQARGESPLGQQWFAVPYGPACNCWRIEGVARLERGRARPDFGTGG